MGQAPRAIVCDDAPGYRAMMAAFLHDAGLEVVAQAATWQEAQERSAGVDVVVCDLWMPLFDREALERLRAARPDATLAVVTALDPARAAEHVAGIAIDLLLSKSAPPAEVAALVAGRARERAAASEA